MPAIRGITIAVGEPYACTLGICLPRNMRFMAECLVVTTPDDEAVKAIASSVPGVRILETDAFHKHGAMFNKGLAMEQGFDILGRDGWILIHDADILLPDEFSVGELDLSTLYGCKRRMLIDPATWREDLDWRTCQHNRDGGPIGFFQLFNASALKDIRPWYDVTFAHAGGGDARFIDHFDPGHRKILPVDVLHLGPHDTHWWGVSDKAKDMMAAFIVRNGWARSHPRVDRSALGRVGELVDRVEVPGYPKSTYELPFVRRAKSGPR